MRSILLCGAAALALAAAAAADAQRGRPTPPPVASPDARWETNVYELYWKVEAANDPAPALAEIGERLVRWRAARGITPTDMPEELRRRPFSAYTVLALDVDAAGVPGACRVLRSSGDPRLDSLACTRTAALPGYRPYLIGPGRPVAARWIYAIGWETLQQGRGLSAFQPAPPSPPPPPPSPDPVGVWPRFEHYSSLRPASLPAIQAMFPPAARRRAATVSLDLVTTPAGGITECRIGVGSRDPALDEASCAAARQLDLRYDHPWLHTMRQTLPLQVVWNRRGGSHIRLPLVPAWRANGAAAMPRDPADRRTATHAPREEMLQLQLTPEDLAGIQPLYPRSTYAFVAIKTDGTGRIRQCAVTSSTRLPALDARLCRIVRARLRTAPRTDIFGDPVEAEQRVYVRFPPRS